MVRAGGVHEVQLKKVELEQGWMWYPQAWRLFVAAPGPWVLITLVLLLVSLVLGLIPVLGGFALNLITPGLVAGTMLAARAAEAGEPVSVPQLFAGLGDPQRRGPLLVLGALLMGAWLVLALVLVAVAGTAALTGTMMMGGEHQAPGAAGLLATLLVLALGIGLSLAFVYAPALVMLDDTRPLAALRASLDASLANLLPLLVAGLIYLPLALIASLPLLLGWLVLTPVTFGLVYRSYRAIFHS
jgi:uncharacterized membrane protein